MRSFLYLQFKQLLVKEVKLVSATCTYDSHIITCSGSGNISINEVAKYKSQAEQLKIMNGVEGIDNNAFYSFKSLTSIEIDSPVIIGTSAFDTCTSLQSVKLPNGIQIIGDYAFQNCKSLPQINLPDSITHIGKGCFYACYKLASITFPKGLNILEESTFYACSHLLNVSLPDTMTHLGPTCFKGCINLESIKLSENLIKIDNECFAGCSSLEKINLPDKLQVIGEACFQGCISLVSMEFKKKINTLHDDVVDACNALKELTFVLTEQKYIRSPFVFCPELQKITIIESENMFLLKIPDNYFQDCQNLKEVVLDTPNILSFGANSFRNCERLEKVTFKTPFKDLQNIFLNCFDGCKQLTEIILPDSVSLISSFSFRNCISLRKMTIPPKVTILYSDLFYGCTSLESVTFNDNINSIGISCFQNCKNLKEIVNGLPKSLTMIGSAAFCGCSKLESVTINENLYFISDNCFKDCLSLQTVTFDNNIKNLEFIYENAFQNCYSLTKIILPNCVTFLGNSSFGNCSKLSEVVLGKSLKDISSSAFEKSSNIKSITYPLFNQMNVNVFDSSKDSITQLILVDSIDNLTLFDDDCFNCFGNVNDVVFAVYSLKYIGQKTFNGFKNMETLSFTKCNVIEIKEDAVSNHNKLNNMNFDANELYLDVSCFRNIDSLHQVTISSKIISFKDFSFADSTSLNYINMMCEKATFGNSIFENCSNLNTIDCNIVDGLVISVDFAKIIPYVRDLRIASNQVTIKGNSMKEMKNLVNFEINADITLEANSLSNSNLENLIINTQGQLDFQSSIFNELSNLQKLLILKSSKVTFGENVFGQQNILSEINVTSPSIIFNPHCFDGLQSLEKIVANGIVEKVGEYSFNNCSKLSKIDFISNVQTIEDSSFNECSSLLNFTIKSDNLNKLGNSAFKNCQKLQNITINSPQNLSISDHCFCSCYEMTFLNSSDLNLGQFSFHNCKNLRNISGDILSVSSYSFSGCESLELIQISNLEIVPSHCFENCISLQKFITMKKIQEVSDYGFYNCPKLKEFKFDNVSFIGDFSFSNTGIYNLTLTTMVILGNYSFANCNELSEVYLANLSSIASNVFVNDTKLSKFVYCGTKQIKSKDLFTGCSKLKEIFVSKDYGKSSISGVPCSTTELCVSSGDNQIRKKLIIITASSVFVLIVIVVIICVVASCKKQDKINYKESEMESLLFTSDNKLYTNSANI